MSKNSYIALELSSEYKRKLEDFLKTILSEEDYYYSDVVPSISGDVTDKVCITMHYGLTKDAIKDKCVKNILNNFKPFGVKIEKLEIVNGYQNLYKILRLKVVLSEELKNLNEEISRCKSALTSEYVFDPHITMAYLKSSFQNLLDFDEEMQFPKESIFIKFN